MIGYMLGYSCCLHPFFKNHFYSCRNGFCSISPSLTAFANDEPKIVDEHTASGGAELFQHLHSCINFVKGQLSRVHHIRNLVFFMFLSKLIIPNSDALPSDTIFTFLMLKTMSPMHEDIFGAKFLSFERLELWH